MIRRDPKIWVALALAVGLLGADTAAGQTIVCTLELRAGIELEVREAGTWAAAAHGAHAEANDGPYWTSLEIVEWESDDPASAYLMAGAYERPGSYAVTVTRSGYRPWVASAVHVIGGSCHVRTVRLRVFLERAE